MHLPEEIVDALTGPVAAALPLAVRQDAWLMAKECQGRPLAPHQMDRLSALADGRQPSRGLSAAADPRKVQTRKPAAVVRVLDRLDRRDDAPAAIYSTGPSVRASVTDLAAIRRRTRLCEIMGRTRHTDPFDGGDAA